MEPSKPESKPVGAAFAGYTSSRWDRFWKRKMPKESGRSSRIRLQLRRQAFQSPFQGSIYVVQLVPVEDSKEASSLLTRIESEEKLKPLIIKVPAGD